MKKHLKALKLDELIQKTNTQAIFKKYPFLKDIPIYENRLTRECLGAVITNKGVIQYIELSSQTVQESIENLRETLIHELCHVIAIIQYSDRTHGLNFQNLMRSFGYNNPSPEKHQTTLTTELVKENRRYVVKKIDKGQEMVALIKRMLAEV